MTRVAGKPGEARANGLNGALAEAAELAVAGGLIYVTDAEPGIRRRRRGKVFRYVHPDGRAVASEAELARIAGLAIPPAYTDVWICTRPRGHLQATGRDARRRKQYRYHAQWRELRDHVKFDRMIDFGVALPRLRRRLHRDLRSSGLSREKVLAVVVTLLDHTAVRIGNREYARDNASFGLTTLHDRHARLVRDGRVLLRFRGKGGADHEIAVDDRRISRIVRRCQELPGQQLFQYVDDDGERRPVDSGQINDYLRETTGMEVTAKDFRTWAATVRAIALLACTPVPAKASERTLKSHIARVVKQVAAELRNTPAVCRKSYINPMVFDAWRSGTLHRAIRVTRTPAVNREAERMALVFLKRQAKKRTPGAARILAPEKSRARRAARGASASAG